MPAVDLITANPDSNNPAAFAVQADLAWVQLKAAIPQLNTAFAALNNLSTSDTSSTSNSIGSAGATRTFTVSSGKSFLPGQFLIIADTAAPATNLMVAIVTSYSGTTLNVTVVGFRGSGTKTSWTISLSPPPPQLYAGASLLHLHTGNGHGSTNDKIRRMTTTVTNTGQGTDWTYTDSAANGGSITFLVPQLCSVVYTDKGSGTHGLSRNSSQLTTAFASITEADKLAQTDEVSSTGTISVTTYFATNDVLRMHSDGSLDNTAGIGRLRIERLL